MLLRFYEPRPTLRVAESPTLLPDDRLNFDREAVAAMPRAAREQIEAYIAGVIDGCAQDVRFARAAYRSGGD